MVPLVIFIGILLVLGFIVLKAAHVEKKLRLVILIILGLLLYFSVAGLFSSEEVDLSSPRGVINAVYLYVGWIGDVMVDLWDIGKDTVRTVGNVIRFNESARG